MRWLHVDIDPAPGEPIEQEQERILALLRNPPEGIPPPTVIVFSGGGYQAYWKLREPRVLNGTVEDADHVGRYNLRLAQVLGGDHCHNIDRIMRLPGTLNRPNKKKRAKGRMVAQARTAEWHE